MANPRVLIVTPAYEEWPNLFELAPKVLDVISSDQSQSRWVIIAEPSAPGDLLATLTALAPDHIIVLPRPINRSSFGDALQMGIDALDEDDEFIIFMDGDGSHEPARIPVMLAAQSQRLESRKADIVIASRYVRGGRSDNSLPLKIMSLSVNLVFRLVFRLSARDLSTNFKLYRADLLRGSRLSSKNFEAVEELLLIARFRNNGTLAITEIPDHFRERNIGTSKRRLGQFIGSYMFAILRLQRQVRDLNS